MFDANNVHTCIPRALTVMAVFEEPVSCDVTAIAYLLITLYMAFCLIDCPAFCYMRLSNMAS